MKKSTLLTIIAVVITIGVGIYAMRQKIGTYLPAPQTKNKRTLLTVNNQMDYLCNGHGVEDTLNDDPPNTTVTYSNIEQGISFAVPYNERWGNEKFRVLPYEESSDAGMNSVNFGPFGRSEGCAGRPFFLIFYPLQTVAEIIAHANYDGSVKQPKETRMYGLRTMTYTATGLCDTRVVYIFGKKRTYALSNFCDTDVKPLENIIKTIKLIE